MSVYFIILTSLLLFHEHVDGSRNLQRNQSWLKNLTSHNEYCDDENIDDDDDYDYDDFEIEAEEEEEDEDDFVARDLNAMLRRSNRRWYSVFQFKWPKKSRSKREISEKKERKLLKKARKLFRKGNFKEAARCCSAAIKNNPNSENYMNRALCYLNSRHWDLAVIDLQMVLVKNPYHVRSHYLLGLVLLELKNLDAAIEHLQRALDVGKEKKIDDEDVVLIASQLEIARRKQRDILERKEVLAYLERLMRKDTQRQIAKIKACETNGSDDVSQKKIEDLNSTLEKMMTQLKNAFAQFIRTQKMNLLSKEGDTDVPGYLCDKITYELFKDPVVTLSGITYERETILQHLKSGDVASTLDPVSRKRLHPDRLIPNNALKQAVETFRRRNDRTDESLVAVAVESSEIQ